MLRDALAHKSAIEVLEMATSDVASRGLPPYGIRPTTPRKSPVPPDRRWVPDLYDDALELIEAAYRDRGYLEVQVGAPEVTLVDNEVSVRVRLREGRQSLTESVRFVGNRTVASGALLDIVAGTDRGEEDEDEALTVLKLGGAYSPNVAEDARIAMVRKYRDLGFLYANISSETKLNAETGMADVTYRIEEGPKVLIRNVLVRGNEHTMESIIRSRISTKSGDPYRLEQALEDRRSVAELGVFSSVQVKLIDEEKPEERKDLITDVRERKRQPVGLSFGVSTAEGPRLGASYAHLNVFGTAAAFNASAKFNRQLFFSLYGEFEEVMRERYADFDGSDAITKAIERDVRLGIRSPRLKMLPFDPALRLDFFVERTNAVPFSLDTTAWSLGFDFKVARRISLTLEPQISLTNLECPVVPVVATSLPQIGCTEAAELRGGASRLIEEGERRTFKVGPVITIDYRNNPLNPSRGWFATTEASYAVGQARESGGDPFRRFSFVKFEGGVTGYIPAVGAVLVLSVGAGTVRTLEGEGVPVDERFYLGGRDTLRGFAERTLIPEDVCVFGSEETIPTMLPAGCVDSIQRTSDGGRELAPVTRGGNTFLNLKSELRLPITEAISLGVFVDAGNLWIQRPSVDNFRLRVGTGAGLRYNTPVGALALNVGVNPSPRIENAESRSPILHFSIGSF